MISEHDAIQKARPSLGPYYGWVLLLGGAAYGLVMIGDADDYYRRGPSGPGLAVLAWILGMSLWPIVSGFIQPDFLNPSLKRIGPDQMPNVRVRQIPNPDVRERLRLRHEAVKEEYGEYLSDISQIIEMPLLADESCEDTHAFVAYLVTCEDASRGTDLEYERAVDGLEIRWRAAVNYARKKKWTTLPPADQKAIRRAKALLDRALDPTATPPERQASLQKALDLLETVVHVPAQALAGIAAEVQRMAIDPGN
ncbi:MAG: hypothetical protein R2720_12390 [Candidatus Nanopelagicales bacterium]